MQIRKTSLFTLTLVLAGCARTSPDTSPATQVASDLPATNTNPDDPAAVAVAAMPPEAEVEAPPKHLTNDDEIFGVLDEINKQAIDQAEYAVKWAKSQRVKEFAALMLTDHNDLRKREDTIRDNINIGTSGSKLADDIKNNSQQKIDIMKKVDKGDPLDKAYIDISVDAHAMWIEFIDTKLLPYAQMPALRVQLETLRSTLERHHNIAKDIQATYEPAKS